MHKLDMNYRPNRCYIIFAESVIKLQRVHSKLGFGRGCPIGISDSDQFIDPCSDRISCQSKTRPHDQVSVFKTLDR